jgi:hypothetical protein
LKLKHLIGIAGLAAFLASWIAVGMGYIIGVGKSTWVVLVVIAAFASEGLFWCVAFMLGLGIVDARKKIWRRLKESFAGRDRMNVTHQQAARDTSARCPGHLE